MPNPIRPYLSKRVLVVNEQTPVHQVARAMSENRVGSALISDGHSHVVGIVTDRDIATQVLGFGLANGTPVSEIMADSILKINLSSSLEEAIKIMRDNGIRRLPVIETMNSGKERAVGMLSLDDLIAAEALNIHDLGHIVRAQIRKPHRLRRQNPAREARLENTLNRFYKIMAEKMNLQKERAENMTFFILKDLVKSLPFSLSMHLISELPNLLQEDLLRLRAGSRIKMRAEILISDLTTHFQLTESDARDLLRYFWLGLESFLDHGVLRQLLSQMPEEVRILFRGQKTMEEEVLELGVKKTLTEEPRPPQSLH